MKTLIIGARGFIGSALVPELLKIGADVTCVSRGSRLADFDQGVRWFPVMHTSQQSWNSIIAEKFDVIYHMGWSTIPKTAEDDPVADLMENVGTSLRLLTAVKELSPHSRIIFSSSGGTIYGRTRHAFVRESHALRPISAYGVGKLAFEQYLGLFRAEHKIDTVSARVSNPYGPEQLTARTFGAVSTFVRMGLSRQKITIFGSRDIVRDYIYVSDLCDALVKLGTVDVAPGAVNIGTGVGTSLSEIIETLEEVLGRQIEYEVVEGRTFDLKRLVLDVSRLKLKTGWHAKVDLREGIRQLCAQSMSKGRTGPAGRVRRLAS